jgi:hypothetical protein
MEVGKKKSSFKEKGCFFETIFEPNANVNERRKWL